jgi:hypothetical protein
VAEVDLVLIVVRFALDCRSHAVSLGSPTSRFGLSLLTATDTIVELSGHIKVLVARSVVRSMKRTVVGDDVGDVAVLAVAKFGIAIASGTTTRRGVRRTRCYR